MSRVTNTWAFEGTGNGQQGKIWYVFIYFLIFYNSFRIAIFEPTYQRKISLITIASPKKPSKRDRSFLPIVQPVLRFGRLKERWLHSDVEVGDWVIADDPTTPGEIEKRQVLQTFVREADVLVDLYVDGEVISTTEEHLFWVVDTGWVIADDLRGDLLITEDGVIVDGIEERQREFEVYNFEVEDFYTPVCF